MIFAIVSPPEGSMDNSALGMASPEKMCSVTSLTFVVQLEVVCMMNAFVCRHLDSPMG